MIAANEQVRGPSSFWARWSLTHTLIFLNVAVFVAQNASEYHRLYWVYQHYALSMDGLRHGRLWQLVTFQFLHAPIERGGVFHLLGNLFVIQIFGGVVEKAVGKGRFAALYLLGGMLGGLLQVTGGIFWPAHFGLAVVGASAGACALVAAFARLYPHERMHMFFLPVAFRSRTVLLTLMVASVVCLFLPARGIGGVAHCAHLGGLLTGWFLARARRGQPAPPAVVEAEPKVTLQITPAME